MEVDAASPEAAAQEVIGLEADFRSGERRDLEAKVYRQSVGRQDHVSLYGKAGKRYAHRS